MPRKETLISGFGGQGVVLAGRLLGLAATLSGFHATMLVSHGTETRGGYVRSQVVISDDLIDSPSTGRPDVFCALSQAAYVRFRTLAASGAIIHDPDFVKPAADEPARLLALPARAMALEKLGSELSANLIALGAILRQLGLIPLEQGLRAVRETVRRNLDKNLSALELGYHYFQ